MHQDIRSKHPNFFIIGFPKCGTTAMSHYLSGHPEVFVSPTKETGYYSSDIKGEEGIYTKKTLKEYLNFFRNVDLKKHKRIGEATTNYVYSKIAIDRILKERPDSKFIVMIRNPVDACPSMFFQHQKITNKKIRNPWQDFNEAWTFLRKARLSGSCLNDMLSYYWNKYDELFKYSEYIRRLIDRVDRSNVCFILFDDFIEDNQKQFSKVCQFLEIDESVSINYTRVNDSYALKERPLLSSAFGVIKRVKHFLNRNFFFIDKLASSRSYTYMRDTLISLCFSKDFSQSVLDKKKVSLQIKKEILLNYSEDIMYVEKLLGRDLSHWRDLT